MISSYVLNDKEVVLSCDPAGENPIYIYRSHCSSYILYSESIKELLNDERVIKPLEVTDYAISFLLQCGVVPPPKTAYKNIFICSIGDSVRISTVNNEVKLKFDFEFPFLHKNRLKDNGTSPDKKYILDIIADATISKMDMSKECFLFHSAGKDSNTIAIALAEAGLQDKVTLISHKSKGAKDESEISKEIAKKLGFKHNILHETEVLETNHLKAIESYFYNAPMPSIDNVSLAYPMYTVNFPELVGSNLIDGMGNDIYIGHIPAISEFKRQNYSRYLKHFRFLTRYSNSENILNVVSRTRSEWCGMFGLSYKDTKNIFEGAIDVFPHWLSRDNEQDDYLDFRSLIRGGVIDPEIFTRKIRNFGDSINSNVILPFTNIKVSDYFSKLPENIVFDRKKLKNKLVLRDILKEKLDLDSDSLGKMSYSFYSRGVVLNNWEYIKSEIVACKKWDVNEIIPFLNRLENKMRKNNREGGVSTNMIYRVFLISCWLNRSKYLVSLGDD